jgi:hypothetical protein
MFEADLNASLTRNKVLPVVIVQKIGTTGEASKWPEEVTPENYSENESNLDRNLILNTFLMKNNYKTVWENIAFRILIPDKTYENLN